MLEIDKDVSGPFGTYSLSPLRKVVLSIDRLHLALGFGVKCAWAAGTPIVLEPVDESYRLGNWRRGRSREERKIRVIPWPDFLSNACGHLVVGVFLFLAGERSV